MASHVARPPRRIRVARALVSAAILGSACILHTAPAQADITSFLSAGGGYSMQRDGVAKSNDGGGTASFAIGVGTDPIRKVVLAGMFRSTTAFGLGTDLSLAARVSTGGFARGDWGLALDFGPGWRSNGDGQYGKWPLFAQVTGGAPWGVQLGVGAQFLKLGGDDPSAVGFMAVLELDLLRLTVMRQGSSDKWWPNPAPAGGRMAAKLPALAGLLW
ncbi:MAG: hypothetical protein U0270_19415 [Labilithrix sp.]